MYTQAFFKDKTKEEAYDIYFKACLEAVTEIDDFTTFGHLDYIPRYAPFGDYDFKIHKEIIEKILKVIIKKNKALEMNTSGFVTEKRQYPKQEVIKLYKQLGGTKITYGSDAHDVRDLGRYFDKVKT